MPERGPQLRKEHGELARQRTVELPSTLAVEGDGTQTLQPSLSDVVCENVIARRVIVGLLIVLALVSAFGIRPMAEDTKTWTSTVEVIDQKKTNVLALTTSCIALSAGISALPNDTGTPVAEQLAQLSGSLGIVLAVLYLEKYLLTILGFLSFGILIPVALALFAISLAVHGRLSTSTLLRRAATRILVVAVIAVAVVPASVWVTQKVDETYQTSIAQTEQKAEKAKDAAAEKKAKSKKSEKAADKNIIEQLVDGASGIVNTVTGGIKSMTDEIVSQVTDLIEGVIVMIVTSCVIPLLVLAVFLWLGHTLLGLDMSAPTSFLMRRLQAPAKKKRISEKADA